MALVGTTTFSPVRSDLLADAFCAFDPEGIRYACLDAAPACMVDLEGGELEVLDIKNFTKTLPLDWARGANRKRVQAVLSKLDYATHRYALAQGIDELDSSPRQYKQAKGAMNIIRTQLLKRREIEAAAALQNTSVFTGASYYLDASSTPWSNATTGVPVSNVLTAKTKLFANSQMIANTITITYQQLLWLRANSSIRDEMKYTTLPTEDAVLAFLPALFGVPKVAVSSVPGAFSDNYATVSVSAAPNSPSNSASAFRTLIYDREGNVEGAMFDQWLDPDAKQLVISAYGNECVKPMAKELAFLIKVAAV